MLRVGGCLLLGLVLAQDKPAYLLYDSRGRALSYKEALRLIERADVFFFGELHDDPIAHWLAYELFRDLYQRRGDVLVLGMEMFETDQQEVLSAYLKGELSMQELRQRTQLWPNFFTDYAPLVEWARQQKVPVYATNAPRLLAREIARQGIAAAEAWNEGQRRFVAPLPFPRLDSLPSYQRMTELSHGHGISAENLRLAQMLKDATMAYRISQVWRPRLLFFHVNGRYHSDYHEGIVAYLRLYAPQIKKVVTLTTERVSDPKAYHPAQKGLADIILAVPETMTRTH